VRPVPLEIHIQGYDIAHVPSRLLAMAKPAYYAVVNHAVEQPAIVFVPSAKQAQLTAVDLLTFAMADDEPRRFLHAAPDDIAPFLLRIKEGPDPSSPTPTKTQPLTLTLTQTQARTRTRTRTQTQTQTQTRTLTRTQALTQTQT